MMTQSLVPLSPVHIDHKQDTITQKVIFLYCLFFFDKAPASKFVVNVDAPEGLIIKKFLLTLHHWMN